jgi:hypothetical protein
VQTPVAELIAALTVDQLRQVVSAGVDDHRDLERHVGQAAIRTGGDQPQDFFEVDPVRYAGALGEDGLAAYRRAVAEHEGPDSFAVRYAASGSRSWTVISRRSSGNSAAISARPTSSSG